MQAFITANGSSIPIVLSLPVLALRVLLVGSSGLIGGHLQDFLLKRPEISWVDTIRRKPGATASSKLTELIAPLDDPEVYNSFQSPDAVFCCLGTTIKKAGSQEAFRKVDYTYPVQLALWASKAGVPAFHLVTAMGADAESRIFYNRIKGEVERDIAALNFASTCFYRPSLLLGDRSESRPMEKLAQQMMPMLNPLMVGPLKAIRPIAAKDVAIAMVKVALNPRPGQTIYSNDQLISIAHS